MKQQRVEAESRRQQALDKQKHERQRQLQKDEFERKQEVESAKKQREIELEKIAAEGRTKCEIRRIEANKLKDLAQETTKQSQAKARTPRRPLLHRVLRKRSKWR